MAYEQKPNTGSLFKNDRKESDNHPDYKGSALIDGLGECWLDAWINTTSDGRKYMSLKLKPKDQSGNGRSAGNAASSYANSRQADSRSSAGNAQYDDDEVPF